MEALIARIAEDAEVREQLGITADQIKTLRDAARELGAKAIELRAELEKGAMEQARLLAAAEIDEPALMQRVEETGAVRTELAKLRMKQLVLAKRTLTHEQISGLRTKMRQNYRKRRGVEDGEGEASEERRRPRHPRGATRSSAPEE